MNLNVDRPPIRPISLLVLAAGIAIAAIHFYLVPDEFGKGATVYGTLFTVAGASTLAALAAMYVPWQRLKPLRTVARLALIGATLASIIVYVALGYYDLLGWITKVIEAVLIYAATLEMLTTTRSSTQ